MAGDARQSRRSYKKTLLLVSNTKEEAEFRLQDIMVAAGLDQKNCNEDVVELLDVDENRRGVGVWKELVLKPSPCVRTTLVAAIGIHFFAHATGIGPVVAYRMLNDDGTVTRGELFVSCILGLLPFNLIIKKKIICNLVATFLVDRFGRRQLLLTSIGGIFVTLSALGLGLTMAEHYEGFSTFRKVAQYSYVAFFSLGIGPV
ncbi:hypothetical protein CerSpe_253640 [Prunus speciosa]